jgi:hypothetical protein
MPRYTSTSPAFWPRAWIRPCHRHPLLVWLHTPGRIPWAVLHVVRRHGVALTDVIVLDVQVPRSWLQHAGRGLWTCDRVIAPGTVVRGCKWV